MKHRNSPPSGNPPPLRPPPWPPKPSTSPKLSICSSSLAVGVQAATGSSADIDSQDSDDEPDPYADAVVLSLLPVASTLYSRRSKVASPVKLLPPAGELPVTGFDPFPVKRTLLLFVINFCGAHLKFNKGPVRRVFDRYCSTHSPPRCVSVWPCRFQQIQHLDFISPPLTMPSCACRCSLRGCFPGTEARRSSITEWCLWFSFAWSTNTLSFSSTTQTAPGSSSERDSLDSDDEPDPDVDSLDPSLLTDGFFSRSSKPGIPVKLSASFREFRIGFISFSAKPRRSLLLFGTIVDGVHLKLNKGPIFRAFDCYCSNHSPLRCSPFWPSRSLWSQQLASTPPPLPMPLCTRCCCRRGCLPGIEARRSFTIECIYWSSLACLFDWFLGSEARRPLNRVPSLYSSRMKCVLKSFTSVATVQALHLIRSLFRVEESLKLDFKPIKTEAFSSEIVGIFFILSFTAFVYVLIMHPLISEEPRASEIWMPRYVIR